MVFNPWHTTPAMMPTDPAIAAPTGDKTVIFFSAQQTRNDKWLISPLLNIHEDYKLSLKAKAYSSMYPESLEFCISEGGDQPADFSQLSVVEKVSAEQWTLYETDLSRFAGQTIRLAVHYTSYDAFLLQVDDGGTVGHAHHHAVAVDVAHRACHLEIIRLGGVLPSCGFRWLFLEEHHLFAEFEVVVGRLVLARLARQLDAQLVERIVVGPARTYRPPGIAAPHPSLHAHLLGHLPKSFLLGVILQLQQRPLLLELQYG
jgi:hypothetical protein